MFSKKNFSKIDVKIISYLSYLSEFILRFRFDYKKAQIEGLRDSRRQLKRKIKNGEYDQKISSLLFEKEKYKIKENIMSVLNKKDTQNNNLRVTITILYSQDYQPQTFNEELWLFELLTFQTQRQHQKLTIIDQNQFLSIIADFLLTNLFCHHFQSPKKGRIQKNIQIGFNEVKNEKLFKNRQIKQVWGLDNPSCHKVGLKIVYYNNQIPITSDKSIILQQKQYQSDKKLVSQKKLVSSKTLKDKVVREYYDEEMQITLLTESQQLAQNLGLQTQQDDMDLIEIDKNEIQDLVFNEQNQQIFKQLIQLQQNSACMI